MLSFSNPHFNDVNICLHLFKMSRLKKQIPGIDRTLHHGEYYDRRRGLGYTVMGFGFLQDPLRPELKGFYAGDQRGLCLGLLLERQPLSQPAEQPLCICGLKRLIMSHIAADK